MILVSGYYGFDNLGDEGILAVLCADLVSLGAKGEDIVVLSNDPIRTMDRLHVAALPRYDFSQIWRALGSARLMISGGGSLLQDVTSRRSIPYYLGLVELAQLRRVPVVMYGQGIGPVQSKVYRSWISRAFRRSQVCSVRDAGSLKLLLDWGVPAGKINLTADPVFQQEPITDFASKSSKILLNLRPYMDWERHQGLWSNQVALWQHQGFSVEFIPLGPGDLEMGHTLQHQNSELNVHPQLTLATLENTFSGATLCVSMRLHGLIFSALHDCQPIGLNYDPKVVAICQQLQLPFWELEELNGLNQGLQILLGRAEQHRSEYRGALANLRGTALKNRAMLAQVLG